MHEHGLMTRLIERAIEAAEERGGALRAIKVRLGAMATSDEAHFRGDFEHVREELGVGPIDLEVEMAPDHPAGVEIVSIVVAEGAGES